MLSGEIALKNNYCYYLAVKINNYDMANNLRNDRFNIYCQSQIYFAYVKHIVALRPLLDQHRLAYLSSATQPNSGAWMNCLPSTAIGTLLDNESFRIAISQRLGLPLCPAQIPLWSHSRQIWPTSSLLPLQRWSFTTTLRFE